MTKDAPWSVGETSAGAADLARSARIPELVAQLLIHRGVVDAKDATSFLTPDESGLHDPLRMKGMAEAADVLFSAARGGRKIVVFGDYDVDGVTSVAQLRAALRRVGAHAIPFLPHRLRDGYGLRPETVRRVLDEHRPGVLVTVDCGITAAEGVAVARDAGVEVIVTDHHLVPDVLPAGAVVINPRQPGCGYPEKDLAATGIAMKLSEAVARRGRVSLSRESLLRCAALGTIADLVPLRGENRVIAALGLAALAGSRCPGLKALLVESGIPPGCAPTAEEVAFRLAPRLNAAGRLDTAELALSLFEERDPERSRAIAAELSFRNAERQAIERRVVSQARELFGAAGDPREASVALLAAEGWHRGVLGIAASRLAREWQRPVLLFSLEGGLARGSGRSVPGVSLHGALKEIERMFTEFGGHDQAVGFSLPASRLDELREAALDVFARRVPPEALRTIESAEARLDVDGITPELLAWLARLEPHGMGNPRPVFSSRCRAAGPFRALGASGARGRLRTRGNHELDAITWKASVAGALSGREALASRVGQDGADVDIHYAIRRGRSGAAEAEILALRSAVGAGQEAVA